MKNKILKILMFTAITLISSKGFTQTAAEILTKVDEVMYAAQDMSAKNKIILINRSGQEEVREAFVMQKGNEMRLLRFTSPASQAGISTLSLPNDVMYLYLPSFGRERRIAGSAKNQNFAGTDFSYDDLESRKFSDKYNSKLISTDAKQFVLELTPKTGSAYSKVILKVDRQNFYPLSTEFYDKGNNKIKEAQYTFKKIGKYWNPSEIVMHDLKKNHKTKMLMSDVKYDQGLSDDEFSIRKLKQ